MVEVRSLGAEMEAGQASDQAPFPPLVAGARPSRGGAGLAVVVILFLAAAAAVNPLREAPYDDDWAFGETVQHLLETGQYRLNDWLAPNMPLQAVWGALFCLPGGYSFAALRLSTIVLAVIGMVAFRGLAVEHGISRGAANLLTLCLGSSPLFFKLSLTFLSDVPFLAVTLVATLFYTRALRDERWSSWLAASLAASAAIFIRQFGMALVGGIVLIWLVDARRWQRLPRYLLGVLLPGAAALWQLNQGWNHSTWAQALLLSRQRVFLWGGGLLKNVPWRPFVLSEYVAFLLPALVFVAAVALVRELRGRRLRAVTARSNMGGTIGGVVAWTILFVASNFYASRFLAVDKLMPFLPWYFEILKLLGTKIQFCVTVVAVGGGILFARLFARRYAVAANRPTLNQAVLDVSTGVSFAMALVFFVFGDKDVLIFLPFAAIVVGRQVESVLTAYRPVVAVLCLGMLAGTAIWTREDLCRNEAIWTLAERVHVTGVPPGKIFAGWEWSGYYEFPAYTREVPPIASTTFSDFFERWLAGRKAQAEFLIVHDPRPPSGEQWRTIDRFRYFSVFSRGIETFYTVRREPARGAGGQEKRTTD
jgi:4-amino-4-deoxy-L-arabinose transferase-like glycosyltransferase